jgi:hypothetical protein
MSSIPRNYRVEHLIISPPSPTVVTDITDKVVSFDDFSLESTGKIATAAFTLNAEFGDFITNDNGGATPLLKQFDTIRIVIIDDNGFDRHSKIFYVTTDLAQLSKTTDYFLPLELEGREIELKGIPFAGFFRDPPVNSHEMILKIVNGYLAGIGIPAQPTVSTFFASTDQNEAPKFNPQIWDFTSVDNCYDAMVFVVDQLNRSVSAGGGGNRFGIVFFDDPINDNNMIVRVLIQGSNNAGAIPTIIQNNISPITNIDKVKQQSTGTQMVIRGRPKTGHLYSELDKFVGRLEFYRAIPFYDATVEYPAGVFVRQGTSRFQSNTDVPLATPPPAAQWTPIDVGDFVGFLDYSPITKNRINEFLSSCGNPEGPVGLNDFNSVVVPDSNITIRDKSTTDLTNGTNREFVFFRTNTDDLAGQPLKQAYLISNDTYLHGTPVLVDTQLGAVSGIFAADTYGTGAGNDPNGKAYADSVVIFLRGLNLTPVDGDWIVVREAEEFDQCAVLLDGRVYEYNSDYAQVNNRNYPGTDRRRGATPGTLAWRDASSQFLGNDCFHAPVNIGIVDGLFADTIQDDEPLDDPAGNPYIQNSALQIEYGYNALNLDGPFERVWKQLFNILIPATGFSVILVGLALSLFTRLSNPEYTSLGWWWAIGFPYPLSTHNSLPQIGAVYGGNASTLQEHRYLDLFNLRRTISGRIGFNSVDSDSLFEITGFDLLMNFNITAGGVTIPFTGNIPFVHWAIDRDGVKWKSPKKFLRHLGETDKLSFEYGELTPVYYSRTPLGINNIIENILVPDIEKNRVLLKENILFEGLQCELGYDDVGRYAPNLFDTIIKPTFFQFFSGGSSDDIRFSGTIDAVNWIKTPIAISKFDTTAQKRIITPEIRDYPNVVNIEQLQRIADNDEQVETFQYEQWTIRQGGIADVTLEDSVYLQDDKIVNESDNPGIPNTRLLAVRELHFSNPNNTGMVRRAVGVVKVV